MELLRGTISNVVERIEVQRDRIERERIEVQAIEDELAEMFATMRAGLAR